MGFGVWGLGFGVWGLGFGVWGLGFGVWGLGFGVWGLGFGVWGLGFGVYGLLTGPAPKPYSTRDLRYFTVTVLSLFRISLLHSFLDRRAEGKILLFPNREG